MQRKFLLAVAAVAVVGLVLVAAILFIGSGSQPVWVQHVSSERSGESVVASFEVINNSSRVYRFLEPYSVEVRNGRIWKHCYSDNSSRGLALASHEYQSVPFKMGDLPTGGSLRLKLQACQELKGLQTLLIRFKLRILRRDKRVSLNPFDKTLSLFDRPTLIYSDEFVEPSSPPSPQRSPPADSDGLK